MGRTIRTMVGRELHTAFWKAHDEESLPQAQAVLDKASGIMERHEEEGSEEERLDVACIYLDASNLVGNLKRREKGSR